MIETYSVAPPLGRRVDPGDGGSISAAREIGGHPLLTRLGRGIRYDTWLAWDDRRLAPVVIKALRRHVAHLPRDRAAIAGEARALQRLQHPILVRAFGAELDGDRPHLVLEFLDGPRLSTLLRKFGPLAAEQIVSLGVQLSASLHYIAQEGWVHLDVKPRNVVLTAMPRLIDLSVARTIEDARRISGYVGTDAYMAPEQCDPDRFADIGPAADVWGASVTLFEALTGNRAFSSLDRGERFPQLRAEPPSMPAKAPAVLAAALRSGLEKRPQDRPTAQELYDCLEPLSDWAFRAVRRVR